MANIIDSPYSRLFIGVQPDQAAQDFLDKLVDRLGAQPSVQRTTSTHWTMRTNRHITLCFLGQTPNQLIPALKTGLAAISHSNKESLEVASSLDAFPGNESNLIAAELVASEQLKALNQSCSALVKKLGIETKSRLFRPHITLARNKDGFGDFIPIKLNHKINLNNIVLYQSEPVIDGSSLYTQLQKTRLQVP
ncbi:RNA 2',3'-cyclic phosphodiesterase [Microbulbifer sp. OS29]|uniref:RNA 2',3'-cyclic phosphodiesterase n=1 Tax=Microbulbifer okhotskensis TaxID=2926617 RepID=A0A9X2EKD7_9GAMM|nr:RNA 2',3'-cyclic phosphodiesterase [Microbulbifer okhotskensis]MCO1333281.1 RNA 2',3'-cyclic phosphodiesterase [Microbulbifer okhotskensis]